LGGASILELSAVRLWSTLADFRVPSMATVREMGAGEAGFVLCELEWMRTRLLALLSWDELARFSAAAGDGVAEARPELVQQLRQAMDEVETLVMSFVHRVAALPSKGVLVTSDEVAAAARAALEGGIIDSERALHAAQWVEASAGLEALARSLTMSDSYRFWEVPVERFVGAFHGADRQLARAVVRDAGVVGTMFSDLTSRQLARLVAALYRARGEQR
jgi:hypothetical protein